MTAGGDYDLGSQAQRHDLASGDSYEMAPPGYTGSLNWATSSSKVSCEGEFGCHGVHNSSTPNKGVNGMHHSTTEASYRFLYRQPGNSAASDGTAVNGKESTTWEATNTGGGATTADHNVYDGDGTDSISSFCANCHGGFHESGNTNSASPFVRHPTDEEAVIANVDGTTAFSLNNAQIKETPFGFTNTQVTGMVTTDITTGTAYSTANGKVICMSCHRAHGTGENDILRFDYTSMNAGNSTNNAGCETCHTKQR